MKKVLYIHGLGSSPNKDKLSFITEKHETIDIIAPHIHYRTEKETIFNDLLELSEEVDLIIGSSMGGLMAYYIAKHVGCQVVLFNPAIITNSIDVVIDKSGDKEIYGDIILGQDDDIVDPIKTLGFFQSNNNLNNLTIHLVSNLQHQIPYDVFKKYC